eukprot:31404-Pelagococcus_subviridis.AAC.5
MRVHRVFPPGEDSQRRERLRSAARGRGPEELRRRGGQARDDFYVLTFTRHPPSRPTPRLTDQLIQSTPIQSNPIQSQHVRRWQRGERERRPHRRVRRRDAHHRRPQDVARGHADCGRQERRRPRRGHRDPGHGRPGAARGDVRGERGDEGCGEEAGRFREGDAGRVEGRVLASGGEIEFCLRETTSGRRRRRPRFLRARRTRAGVCSSVRARDVRGTVRYGLTGEGERDVAGSRGDP